MARRATPLTVDQVAILGAGWHCDGSGLWLRVRDGGGASWVYRTGTNGCEHWTLGKARGVGALTLAEAREAVEAIAAAKQRAALRALLVEI